MPPGVNPIAVNKYIILMCRLSRNPGALTSRTPQGHVGLFRGYFTFLHVNHTDCGVTYVYYSICSPFWLQRTSLYDKRLLTVQDVILAVLVVAMQASQVFHLHKSAALNQQRWDSLGECMWRRQLSVQLRRNGCMLLFL
jgi:hypothetical protein